MMNNARMTRKGSIFVPSVVIMTFIVLIAALAFLSIKYGVKDSKGLTRVIGERQNELFSTYQRGENALFYASQSGKVAAERAIRSLAEKDAGCYNYSDYSVWSNRTTLCFPGKTDSEKKFKEKFMEKINMLLFNYSDASLPVIDSVEFSSDEPEKIKIIGKSASPIIIAFGSVGLPVCIGGDITKVPNTQLKQCFTYHDIFTSYLKKNNLGSMDPLLAESLSYWESECNPFVNPGGIMQVDSPCLLSTKKEFRNDPAKWACPTIDVQIDEGTKELSSTLAQFKDAPPGDAVALTLFAYNRGIAIAKKAIEYRQQGSSLQGAMYQACTVDFLKSQSTDYKGKTWEESFALRKADDPEKYKSSATAIDYYCVASGPSYPGRILETFQEVCKNIGGTVSQTYSSTGGAYTVKQALKTTVIYSFSEYDSISEEIKRIADEITKNCKLNDKNCIKNAVKSNKYEISLFCNEEKPVNDEMLSKSMIGVCVKSKYLTERNLQYRIVFFAGDTIPPSKVKNLAVKDTPDAENSITISFASNEETDADHYNVYYSESDFKSIDSAKLIYSVLHDSSKQILEAALNLEDNKYYYFAVTPVDKSGNENKEIQTVTGKSTDDVNPGSAEITKIEKQGLKPVIDISIKAPDTKGISSYSLYIKATLQDSCTEADIASTLLGKKFSDQIYIVWPDAHTIANFDLTKSGLPSAPGTKYCILAIAEDESPEGKPAYSANSIKFFQI